MSARPAINTVSAKGSAEPDSHYYFRGRFTVPAGGTVNIKLLAASWFEAWLDGGWLAEGPARFDLRHPEFQTLETELSAGEHVLALHVHYEGVVTRLMEAETPLFVFAEIEADGKDLPIGWKCLPLDEAFRKTGRRIDCVLGWIEWCRTDRLPHGWWTAGFDDSAWPCAVARPLEVESFLPLDIGAIAHVVHRPQAVAEGPLVNMSMFTNDPPIAFVTRRLDGGGFPAQGRWWRFDLGKVRLGRPEITVDAPAGTVVQVAYGELLHHGRVSPYISSSAGDQHTCNLDHYVLCGGRQSVKPLHPRGARFIEVHVLNAGATIGGIDFRFEERVYYGGPIEGSFRCNDELLNRIWTVGVETLRSCSEDAITDNPTRERGQWLGDAVGAGMDILAVSYGDLRPLRRGLLQAAQCAGADGMIPAVFPGTRAFLPSFAVQWIAAIPHYFEISGDFQTLEMLYPAAVANMRCFDADLCEDGLCMNPTRWNFIDWGYRGASTGFREEREHYHEMDPALSFFYLKALGSMVLWATLLGKEGEAARWRGEQAAFHAKMKRFLQQVDGRPSDWAAIGYHAAALALESGLLDVPGRKAACVAFLRQHILSCFPNNPAAPRLYDPTVETAQLITPFFFHHVFPALIGAGEMEFVLEQIRVCYGWALEEGLTTWPEVFDLRWSHCHQWSGCPTWILSRHVLGLHPRFDLGDGHYELRLESGGLERAEGVVPVPFSARTVSVGWRRTEAGIEYQLAASSPIWLHVPGSAKPQRIEADYRTVLP